MSEKNPQKPMFSNQISSFISMLENARKDYNWNYNRVGELDRLTQDYLHKLELDGLNYKERARIATQLSVCRKERRQCKDTAEILEPLISFYDGEKGKVLYNLLREAFGKTRKVEERMKTRVYVPRVLEDEKYGGK